MLKNFVHQFWHKNRVFDSQERHHNNNGLDLSNKDSFFSNYTVDSFLFVTAIFLVVTLIVMYILCKHMKLKSLVNSLALQQIKEVGAVAKQNMSL